MLIGATIAEQLHAMEDMGATHSFEEAFDEDGTEYSFDSENGT
jgi:hypothetical protein